MTAAIAIHRCFMRMDTRAGYSGMTTFERSSFGFGHFGFISTSRCDQDLGSRQVAIPLVIGGDDEPWRLIG